VAEVSEVLFTFTTWRQDGESTILLATGYNEPFDQVLYRQVCSNCEYQVTVNPLVQAQGLDPMTFTANPECGLEPYTFEWFDEGLNIISTTQTCIIQPNLIETTRYTVTVMDDFQNELQTQATVLASSNPNLTDPNGDGFNTLEDLFLVGQDWRTSMATFDTDGDGKITVLDLQYVNTGNSAR